MGQRVEDLEGGSTTIGVLGGHWRAEVDARGRIVTWEGSALDWWIAAEDRWHDPRNELTVRQQCVDGTPVLETRVRVPGGDVVQRVYAVADAGGVTMIEVENDSPATVPIEGIEVPAGAVSFPIGHHATLRVGIPHTGKPGPLPAELGTPLAVARGWTRLTETASRVVLPDAALVERLVSVRCQVLLNGPADPVSDVVGSLLGLTELVRMGSDAVRLVPEAVSAAERLARAARTCGLDWDGAAALSAVERLLVSVGDHRAAADVAALWARLGGSGAPVPEHAPDGIRFVPWLEYRLARPLSNNTCVLLEAGHPQGWLGANWEVHHLPAGPRSQVGYAVRWHGERPAVLWEITGEPVVLVGGSAARSWRGSGTSGEDLWPEPEPKS